MDLPDPRVALVRFKQTPVLPTSEQTKHHHHLDHHFGHHHHPVDTHSISNVRAEGERLLSRVLDLRKRTEVSSSTRASLHMSEPDRNKSPRSTSKGAANRKPLRAKRAGVVSRTNPLQNSQRAGVVSRTNPLQNSQRAGVVSRTNPLQNSQRAGGVSRTNPRQNSQRPWSKQENQPSRGNARSHNGRRKARRKGSNETRRSRTPLLPLASHDPTAAPNRNRSTTVGSDEPQIYTAEGARAGKDWGDVESLLAESANLESLRDTLKSMKDETHEVFETLPELTRALSAMKVDTANAAGDLEERMKSLVKDYRVMQGILAKAPLGFSGQAKAFTSVSGENRPGWMPPRDEFDYEMLAAEIDDIGNREKAVYQRMKTKRNPKSTEAEPSRLSSLVSQRIGLYHSDMRKHARQSLRYQKQQEKLRKQEEAARQASGKNEHYREPPLQHLAPWMDPSQAWAEQQRRKKPHKPIVVAKPETPWYLEQQQQEVPRPAHKNSNKPTERDQKEPKTQRKPQPQPRPALNSRLRREEKNLPGQHTAARSKSRQDAKRAQVEVVAKATVEVEDEELPAHYTSGGKVVKIEEDNARQPSVSQHVEAAVDVSKLLEVSSRGHPRVRALDSLPSFCTDCLLMKGGERSSFKGLVDGCVACYTVSYLLGWQDLRAVYTEAMRTNDIQQDRVLKGLDANLAQFETIQVGEVIAVVCLALSGLSVSDSRQSMDEAIVAIAPQLVEFVASYETCGFLVVHQRCGKEALMDGLKACVSEARQRHSVDVREGVRATASAFKAATGDLLNPEFVACVEACGREQRMSEMDIAAVLEELSPHSETALSVRAVFRWTQSRRCASQWRSGLDEMLTEVLAVRTTGKVYAPKELKAKSTAWSKRKITRSQVESALRETLKQAIGLRRSKTSKVDTIMQLANVAECALETAVEKPITTAQPCSSIRLCELTNESNVRNIASADTSSSVAPDHSQTQQVSAQTLEGFLQGTIAATAVLKDTVGVEHKTMNPPVCSLGLAPAGVIQAFVNKGEAVDQTAVGKVAVELAKDEYKKCRKESRSVFIEEGPSDEAILQVVTSLLLNSSPQETNIGNATTATGIAAHSKPSSASLAVDQAAEQFESATALATLEKHIGTLAGQLTKSFEEKFYNEVALVRKETAVDNKTNHLEELEQHIEQRERLQRKWEETMMERLEKLREESNKQAQCPVQLEQPRPERIVHEQGIQAIRDEPKAACIGVETQCDILDPIQSQVEESQESEPLETAPFQEPDESSTETPELRLVLNELREVLDQQKQQAQSGGHPTEQDHAVDMANAVREETQKAMVELREWSTAQLNTVIERLEYVQKEPVQPEIKPTDDANDSVTIRQKETRLKWEESSDEGSDEDDGDAFISGSMLSEGQIDVDLGALSDGEQVLGPGFEPTVTIVNIPGT